MSTSERIADILETSLVSESCEDINGNAANLVDGLYCIGSAIQALARAVDRLGNSDAATSMGAIEALGLAIKETGELVSGSIDELAKEIGLQ